MCLVIRSRTSTGRHSRTGELMINEKCRDAVTDLFILLDSRDIARIGTVLKNRLK